MAPADMNERQIVSPRLLERSDAKASRLHREGLWFRSYCLDGWKADRRRMSALGEPTNWRDQRLADAALVEAHDSDCQRERRYEFSVLEPARGRHAPLPARHHTIRI